MPAALQSADRFHEVLATTAGPQWLRRRRAEAWTRFESLPWPSPQDAAWRRLPIADFPWDAMPLLGPAPASKPPEVPAELRQFSDNGWAEGGLLLHHNAEVVVRELADPLRKAGVTFLPLVEAAERAEATLEPLLGRDPALTQSPLAKLNLLNVACWTHGAYISVPKNVQAGQPLRIVHRSSAANGLLAPHTVIVLEPGSELTVIEETFADDGLHAPFIPSVVELHVGEGATLRYYHLQHWGRETFHTYTQHATVERDGQLLTLAASFGGRITKASVETRLTGAGARSELYGVTFGDRQQQFDFHTLQDHVAGHTTSDLLYKTALRDEAASIYTGLIRITKEATQSNAYQANRNLLLSPSAKADSIPMLEILTDDVRCTHGATVGPVDPDQAFYLESRGIPESAAQRMLVEGFFEQVFQKLPDTGLRQRLHAHVERKLESR